MKNKKPNIILHPISFYWINNRNLELSDSMTEIGYIAKSKIENQEFLLLNREETINKLNKLYGLNLGYSIWKRKGIKNQDSLENISKELENIIKIQKILPKEFSKDIDYKLYICGLRIPKADFLYLEYNKLDRQIQSKYKSQDFIPRIQYNIEFIPLLKNERPF